MTKADDGAPERAAKGILAGWLTAKTTTWVARFTVWGMWLAALAAYGGYVWWRVRRMLKDEERAAASAYGLDVRSSSESQQPPPVTPAPQ
jgi:CHASE2 domain-containing sensor protein